MITLVLIALCGMVQAALVTIGNPGNAADTADGDGGTPGVQHYGAVGYTYQISQYEVTGAEFAAATNSDSRVGSSVPNSGNKPAAFVTWYEAAKYCNWLTTGNAYLGAYQFNGSGTLTNVMTRAQMISNGGLFYALPTEDEWYKAAYFKNGVYSLYANGTSIAPVDGVDANYNSSSPWAVGSGTMEQNGTYDMMGNVWEWNESAMDGTLNVMTEARVRRGGGYNNCTENDLLSSYRVSNAPMGDAGYTGFRVVAIPEPATALSLVLGSLVVTGYRRLRKSYGF